MKSSHNLFFGALITKRHLNFFFKYFSLFFFYFIFLFYGLFHRNALCLLLRKLLGMCQNHKKLRALTYRMHLPLQMDDEGFNLNHVGGWQKKRLSPACTFFFLFLLPLFLLFFCFSFLSLCCFFFSSFSLSSFFSTFPFVFHFSFLFLNALIA